VNSCPPGKIGWVPKGMNKTKIVKKTGKKVCPQQRDQYKHNRQEPAVNDKHTER